MPPSREEPRGLLDALLSTRHTDLALAASGPESAAPIVPASEIAEVPGRDVVVELDASAEAPSPAGWRPVRYQLDCARGDLDDVLAFTAPAPLAVYVQVDDPALADTARALTEAGHIPGLPTGHTPGAVADFLAVLAHADTGFVARAQTASDVLALLSGTAAALSGSDVRDALTAPDADRLGRLIPEAIGALREILLAVEVDDTDAVLGGLRELGLTSR
ncbi:hypothetical protein [Rhodococcus artemisiae]|uniref:Uncharacterized protein n=1 Tax=Rhodococcus artemisiae TaxID=714159 RepID=A0ABU7L9D1_9NOCA|nr:hypothetical protein [Rhodococcus artemisiae]MEE2058157.1 hypothetical protein [Rhodococcus artemisiae]